MTKTDALAVRGSAGALTFTPQNLEEAMRFSDMIASSTIVPNVFRGKAGDVLVAIQMGAELGLQPMQALQNIAVINGRPSVWGDAFLAIIQKSPSYEWHKETFDEETMTASCAFKRRGNDTPFVATFSEADAKRAGLWGKQGPWQTHPKRMLKLRARAFAGRDGFSDALRGLSMREEVEDYIELSPTSSGSFVMPQPLPPLAKPEAAPAPAPEVQPKPAAPAPEPPPAVQPTGPEDAASTPAPLRPVHKIKSSRLADEGTNQKNQKWHRYEITTEAGEILTSFSSTVHKRALDAIELGKGLVVTSAEKHPRYGEKITAVELVEITGG